MTELDTVPRSTAAHFGTGSAQAAGFRYDMSRSLPRPAVPVTEGDAGGSPRGAAPSNYPFPPSLEADRRGPRLPPPSQDPHASRRTIQPLSIGETTDPWASRSMPTHHLGGPPAYSSPSAQEPSPTSQARTFPDQRGGPPSFHGPAGRDQPVAGPDGVARPFPREQLPPLSHLIPVEPASASSRSPYSSPWSAGSSRSPRRSPTSGATSYEATSLQASPFSDRSMGRAASFAVMPAHDRSMRGHSHSMSSFPSPQHSAQEAVPYFDRQRHSVATGSPNWPPRSDPTSQLQQHHPRPPQSSPYAGPRPGHGASASPPVGDVIGPSIWTGTHFLPRFIGEREVRGEGPCYFYDDGTHCKTFIDGEAVNAHWGVTKAGKPRKRLAVACLTCREKKIKCDPDFPKCVQCEKFGRVCKFKNAPRGHRTSPEPYGFEDGEAAFSSSHSTVKETADEVAEPAGPANAQDPDEGDGNDARKRRPSRDLRRHSSSISDVDPLDVSQPMQYASKKRRQSSPTDARLPHMRPSVRGSGGHRARPSFHADLFGSGMADAGPSSSFHWRTDPFDVDAELSSHLVHVYFAHINAATYCLFPRRPFTRWAEGGKEKSQDDIMLLYSILTVASNFSTRDDRRELGRELARISRCAVDNCSSRYTLQLAQSRLLLGIYLFATNKPTEGWDISGSGMRTINGLKLNQDVLDSDPRSEVVPEYGLDAAGHAECCRRTFWAAYLMDRYSGVCSGHVTTLHNEDAFVRLPCDDGSYEELACGVDAPAVHLMDRAPRPGSRLGAMAHLVRISCVWGDVLAEIQRSGHRPTDGYEERYEAFYEQIQARLDEWTADLPAELGYSRDNLDGSVRSGRMATFVAMHVLHHAAAMKLNRHVRGELVRPERLGENIRRAHAHARALLRMMGDLATRRERVLGVERHCSAPFTGHAITLACEIVSAKGTAGTMAEVLGLLDGGLAVLDELGQNWSSARAQRARVAERGAQLRELRRWDGDRGEEAPFSLPAASAARSPAEDDATYRTPLEAYVEALAAERKESGSSTTGLISAMSIDEG
ncbi:MAG: hypothetical protein M1832_004473 [Thelocarpon impressellum]|nr:MAG: hypothetical protein M1832_004473 [Thelocarpon impressellum]